MSISGSLPPRKEHAPGWGSSSRLSRAVVYANGVSVRGDSVLVIGRRYELKLTAMGTVEPLSLDSVVGMESYRMGINVPATVALSVPDTAVGVVATVGLFKALFGSCPTFHAYSAGRFALEAEGFSYSIAPLFESRDVDALRVRQPLPIVFLFRAATARRIDVGLAILRLVALQSSLRMERRSSPRSERNDAACDRLRAPRCGVFPAQRIRVRFTLLGPSLLLTLAGARAYSIDALIAPARREGHGRSGRSGAGPCAGRRVNDHGGGAAWVPPPRPFRRISNCSRPLSRTHQLECRPEARVPESRAPSHVLLSSAKRFGLGRDVRVFEPVPIEGPQKNRRGLV